MKEKQDADDKEQACSDDDIDATQAYVSQDASHPTDTEKEQDTPDNKSARKGKKEQNAAGKKREYAQQDASKKERMGTRGARLC